MKKTLLFCIVTILSIGCRVNQNASDIRKLHDSVTILIQNGTLRNDTAMLLKALSLTDSILSIDTTAFSRRQCYSDRAIILNFLGRKKEAVKNTEIAMMLLPKDNPQRLLFIAKRHLWNERKDSAEIYISEVISTCELAQKEKFDENIVLYIVQAIYLRSGEEADKGISFEKHKDSS